MPIGLLGERLDDGWNHVAGPSVTAGPDTAKPMRDRQLDG